MKFAPKDGQTAGFCTTAVCISCPRREGDAPIAIPFGSQPNAFPCGRGFNDNRDNIYNKDNNINITRTITDVHGRHGV